MTSIDNFETGGLRERGSIKDTDVLRLRGAYYSEGRIGPDDAETLFALNDACPVQDPAWSDFFIEAVTDYVVHQMEPDGYVTAANAKWLMEHVARDGAVQTKTELELVVNVLGKSRWSPPSLTLFALEQVYAAVRDNAGPLRDARGIGSGTIAENEVELLRRILYAFDNDGPMALTEPEIAVLCRIDGVVEAAGLNGAWTELFVKALVNGIMVASGYRAPTREEALRREAWLDRRRDLNPNGVLKALVSWCFTSVLPAYREMRPEERAIARLERQRLEIVTNEAIAPCTPAGMAALLGRETPLSPAEAALRETIARSEVVLDPTIRQAIARSPRAA